MRSFFKHLVVQVQRAVPAADGERGTVVMSWLAGGTVLVALILFALAQSLRLPAHFGLQDWLGWCKPATLNAAIDAWHPEGGRDRAPAAVAYLLIDTALFMPLYGLTLLWAAWLIWGRLERHGAARLVDGLRHSAALQLPLLWLVDLGENFGGVPRLRLDAWIGLVAGACALVAAVALFKLAWLWAVDGDDKSGRQAVWLVVGALLAATAIAACSQPGPAEGAQWLLRFTAWCHRTKSWLIPIALAPLVGLCLCWWLAIDLDSPIRGGARRPGEIRSACRQIAMGVVGRSRYVLAMLGLFAAFTLMLDQCRDVLLALATAKLGFWWGSVMLVATVSLGMLSHACWLWARLIGRVKRSGFEIDDASVRAWAGRWARTWARLVMLAPLLITLTLIANVAGDAAIAARAGVPAIDLLWTLLKLALFAIAILGIALWLLRQKSGQKIDVADYYNSVEEVRRLLADPYCRRTSALPAPPGASPGAPADAAAPAAAPVQDVPVAKALRGRALEIVDVLASPIVQPLFALGALAILRMFMSFGPDMSSSAPPALAVLALAMVWWMGPLGLMAMSEQRGVVPWGWMLLGLAGVMAFVSDNHTLPALVIDDVAKVRDTLASLRLVALAGFVVLALASAALWLLLVVRSRPLLRHLRVDAGKGRAHGTADRRRFAGGLVVAAVSCAGLWGLDRWAASVQPAARAGLAEAMDNPPPPGDPLLVVASEGGGARAAYWTARVLAGVSEKTPDWDKRIVGMSGVSGGSMGLAVWRACVRESTAPPAAGGKSPPTVVECVTRGFAGVDALSPLLAGLMFEDVWMRLLPTDWLCRPATGCGMRSRAMAFEREWMRAFPPLAQPLGARRPGEPDLLLNSTVVESGNRGVLANRPLSNGQLPGAEDLLVSRRIPTSPALVTAAHTSARFPGINPLASLPHEDGGPAAAHLVDGGYHDNSGAESAANLVTMLRTKYPQRRVQLVLIRNGQISTACLPQAIQERHDEPPGSCFKGESDARQLLPARDAQRLKLYADLLGPAVTVLNNLGTGAHGREPVAALTAQLAGGTPLGEGSGCAPSAPVCLLDQMEDASLVPLGWSLSSAARDAMDAAADARAEAVRSRQ